MAFSKSWLHPVPRQELPRKDFPGACGSITSCQLFCLAYAWHWPKWKILLERPVCCWVLLPPCWKPAEVYSEFISVFYASLYVLIRWKISHWIGFPFSVRAIIPILLLMNYETHSKQTQGKKKARESGSRACWAHPCVLSLKRKRMKSWLSWVIEMLNLGLQVVSAK